MTDETVLVSDPEVVREEEFVDLLARLEFHKANLHLIRFTDDRDGAADIFTASTQLQGANFRLAQEAANIFYTSTQLQGTKLRRLELQKRALCQRYTALLAGDFHPSKEDDPQDVKDHASRQRDLIFGYLNTAFNSDNPDEVRAKLRTIETATKGLPFLPQEINEARGTIMERFRGFGSYSPEK